MRASLFWLCSRWYPNFIFSFIALKSMFQFSGSFTAEASLNYWARNFDNFLIAKFLGDASLGIYSRAYNIMLLPLTNFSQVISRVLFPSFSSIKKDRARIKNVYLKISRIVALVTFPLMFGIWATADKFVIVIFGNQWADMIPIVKSLVAIGNNSVYSNFKRKYLQFTG